VSEENIEVVHRLYAIWHRDGFGVVPELMDPAVEYVNPPYAVEPGIRRGYDGFAEAARAVTSVYGDYEVDARELTELGDRVVVRAHVKTRSHGNAVPIEAERGYVFDIRDGRVLRFAWFNDFAGALEYARG
jgi:ketosteroid isomerase-like protein